MANPFPEQRSEAHFRWRGGAVSRVEALSDAVFAFSLTLLVVALEVPNTSAELVAMVWQFPAFAVCFAFLVWVWYEHYLYHRRFGFEDPAIIALNGLLLFFVVLYVYPLKFLSSALITARVGGGVEAVTIESTGVMFLYSGGFVGLFGTLTLLYFTAWRRRDRLALDRAEEIATRGRLWSHCLATLVGVLSIALVTLRPEAPALSGLVYFLLGPLYGVLGYRTGKSVAQASEEGSAGDLVPGSPVA